MHAQRTLSIALVAAVLGYGALAAADPAEQAQEPPRNVIVSIDLDTIPNGTVPPPPRQEDAVASPGSTPLAKGLLTQKVKQVQSKKRAVGLHAKMGKLEILELSPAKPELGALYVPWQDGTDFQGESVSVYACHRQDAPNPVRWETLTVKPDGNAQLEIKDLWVEPRTCTVELAGSSQVVLKPIAWNGAKPWLFAVRDEKTVTFLFARSDDLSADAMIGTPFTVRAGFTRVTLPVGRWGSSTLTAILPSLELELPAKPDPNPKSVVAKPYTPPTEIALELVQTMSEKAPTLLVRYSKPEATSIAQ